MAKDKESELYNEAKRQEELSRRLDPRPPVIERKPEAMAFLEGMLGYHRNQNSNT